MNSNNSQHLKLYLGLKQQEIIIGKSIDAFIISSKVDPELWHAIKRGINEFECERGKLIDPLKSTISGIYTELKCIKAMITAENVGKIDLEDFKNRLQSLWKRIQDFKQSYSNIDALVSEQNNLEADLEILTRSIRKHKDFSITGNNYCKISNLKTQSREDPPKDDNYSEVEDFCTLVARTGHTGNWSEEDHQIFLKLRAKHKSVPSLVLELQTKCPDLSRESIVNHVSWYQNYLRLREKQRQAVNEWKARRQRPAAPDKPAQESSTSLTRLPEHKLAEADKKREQIRKWRQEKEEQIAAEQQQLTNRILARRLHAEGCRLARAAALKKTLAKHKLQRQQQRLEQAEPGNKPTPMSAFIMHMYRARDQEFVEKRRSVLANKLTKAKPTIRQSATVQATSKVPESSLFKETVAWQEKHKNYVPMSTTLSYIKDLPKRTIATWKTFETPVSFT